MIILKTKTNKQHMLKTGLKAHQLVAYNGCKTTYKGKIYDFVKDNIDVLFSLRNNHVLMGVKGKDGYVYKKVPVNKLTLVLRSFESMTKDEGFELASMINKTLIVGNKIRVHVRKTYIGIIDIKEDCIICDILCSGNIFTYSLHKDFLPIFEIQQWFYDKGIAYGLHPDSWIDEATIKQS